jgi:hypothetical protein
VRFSLFGTQRASEDSGLTVVDDPYFGRVMLDKSSGWIGTKPFAPIQKSVDFALGNASEGPTERQRDFFQLIEERYPALVEQYRVQLVGDGDPFTDGSSPQKFFDSLRLEFVMLPTVGDGPVEWEMSYTTDLNDHVISLRFTDWRFLEDSWDG